MEPFGYIYLATNLKTRKAYVGQTTQPVKVRWKRHCSDALGVKNRPHPLHNSIRKHGAECWRVETLAQASSFDELNAREAEYIRQCCTLHPNGYNLKPGGNNAGHHAETKLKLAAALLGRKLPPEHVEKLREAAKGRPLTDGQRIGLAKCIERSQASKGKPGRKHTEHSRRKMSESRKGKKKSPEHKAAIAQAHRGMKRSEETRRKISEAHTRRGPVTDETRAKLSAALRGKPRPGNRKTHCKRGHQLPEYDPNCKRRCMTCNYANSLEWRRENPNAQKAIEKRANQKRRLVHADLP